MSGHSQQATQRKATQPRPTLPGRFSLTEGDLIIGKAGASAAATLVERTTRCTAILALPLGKSADGVADALIEHTRMLPGMFAKSVTWDRGSELARHAHVTRATTMAIYFAHPHSPWQRGSNENTNRMIRRYLPSRPQSPTTSPT